MCAGWGAMVKRLRQSLRAQAHICRIRFDQRSVLCHLQVRAEAGLSAAAGAPNLSSLICSSEERSGGESGEWGVWVDRWRRGQLGLRPTSTSRSGLSRARFSAVVRSSADSDSTSCSDVGFIFQFPAMNAVRVLVAAALLSTLRLSRQHVTD
jgi:hypothetical protein